MSDRVQDRGRTHSRPMLLLGWYDKTIPPFTGKLGPSPSKLGLGNELNPTRMVADRKSALPTEVRPDNSAAILQKPVALAIETNLTRSLHHFILDPILSDRS